MIHDIINIGLTLFMGQQAFLYFTNKETMEKLSDEKECECTCKDDNGAKKVYLKNRDLRALNDPLYPPERRVEAQQYPYPNTRFGERTRGEADEYQLIGLLYNTTVNRNYQLFGRRTYPGASEWEYYITGKDANSMEFKYPITAPNKQEIMDGTTITIPIDTNTYNVSIYNYDTYKYNPYVF